MITNKYTSFRHHHDSSESLIDTYQSSSSSSSKSKSSSILSSKESAYDQKHPNSQAVDTTKSKSTATPPSTANTAFTSSSGATKLYTTKHPILALSDDEFLSTPLDVMLSWYDAATTGAATCDDDFGNGLIKRWRSKKSTFCSTSDSSSLLTTTADTTVHSHKKLSPSSLSSSSSSSHITCYLIKQANHYGNGDNICVMNNVSVNMGIFSDDSIIRPVVKTYVDTRHDDQPYVHFEKGFIQGTCSPVNDQWQSKFMPGWNEDWTTSSYQQIDNTSKNSQLGEGTCDEWIDHPVLIVQRDTFANFFHDSEDFINVFIAMTVLQMKFENIQIYLTDLYPKGPFW